jgi:hypothetical protein
VPTDAALQHAEAAVWRTSRREILTDLRESPLRVTANECAPAESRS